MSYAFAARLLAKAAPLHPPEHRRVALPAWAVDQALPVDAHADQAMPVEVQRANMEKLFYKALKKEDKDLENIETPYGALIKTLRAPSERRGVHHDIKYACPFAFLYHACELSTTFATFLEEHLSRPGPASRNPPSSDQALPIDEVIGEARVVMYFDEVVPGNNLRPDQGRTYLAVYWTFLEFPSWFRASQNGWFELCYVPAGVLADIPGEHSKLTALMLAIFWPVDTMSVNFARTGMRVPFGRQDSPAVGSQASPAVMPHSRPLARPPSSSQASPAVGSQASPAVMPHSRPLARPPHSSQASPAVGSQHSRQPTRPPSSSQPRPAAARPPSSSQARPAAVRSFIFLAVFACFVSDEKAIKQLSMAKGASGRKPCLNCQNVVGRVDAWRVPVDGPLVHLSCGDPAKFVPHTPATLQELYSYLRESGTAADGTDGGFSVSEDALLASPMATVANLPDSIFWDWMHCLMSSGGVAQFEVNQVLRRVVTVGIPLEKVDVFSKFVKFPGRTGFSAHFADRVADGDGHHIRAFASEMICMVIIVGLFLDSVIAPTGELGPEIKCFRLLGRIIYQLRLGDEVRGRLVLLRSLIVAHHKLAVSLYPECVRPKLHYMLHLCDCIARFGALLSCFAPERKHRQSKRIGAFAFNQWCSTMLRRTVGHHLQWLQVAANLHPYQLMNAWGKALPPRWRFKVLLLGLVRDNSELGAVTMGRRLQTPRGGLWCNDLLAYRVQDEALRACKVGAGFARMFFKVHERFFALVDDLEHKGGVAFLSGPEHVREIVVEATSLLGAFTYIAHEHQVAIVASVDVFA